ncbi:MAG: TonB-dependent receptor plug domain-containing protein [Leptospira sp.]|nr:TonB-dependent receptor plug domain-containing protein [Leptospira sp.]
MNIFFKRIVSIFLYTSFFFAGALYSQSGNIKIQIDVIDKVGNEPLANTDIIIVETGSRIQTDSLGRVSTELPQLGRYNVRILGQESIDKRSIDVRFPGQKFTLFSGSESAGIQVKGKKDESNLSSIKLSNQEIKRLPGTQGDALRAIQALPGIVPAIQVGLTPTPQFNINITGQPYRNSDRGDFSLRGAGPRANQTYFDGMPVSYPFHLGGQSSVFNNNIISDLEVLTGAYSVRYGYATGGIINVSSTENVVKRSTTINLNTFLSDAYIETPLWEGGYMLAGARKSYPNIFLLQAYPKGIPEDAKYADFSDFQWKFGTDLTQSQKLNMYFFGARDIQGYTRAQAEFENSSSQDSRPPVGLDRGFYTQGISHEWKLTDKIRHKISASRNSFAEYYELQIDNPLTAENIFGLSNTTTQDLYFVENSLLMEILPGWTLDLGGNYRERKIGLQAENITSRSSLFFDIFNQLISSDPTFRALVDGDGVRAIEKGGFAETKVKWNDFLLVLGIREDSYIQSGETLTSPRGSLAYTFQSTKTTIQGGTGVFRNAPVGIEQISTRSGNPNLGMESSEHNVLGISQAIGRDWIVKLEGFRNIFRDLVVNDSFIQDPYAINYDNRKLVENPQDIKDNPIQVRNLGFSNRGYGYSEGIEIFIRKSPDASRTSGWFGWISYSNSVTKRNNNQPQLTEDDERDRARNNFGKTLEFQTSTQEGYINRYDDGSIEFLYNNDRERLFDLDRTHILSVVFGWKINPQWQVGGRFRYATSVPVTQIIGSNQLSQATTFGANLYLPEYSEDFNNHRLPSTHQLDLRIDRFFPYSWGYMNWYLEFINLYGRRNPISEQFDVNNQFSGSNPGLNFDTLNSPFIQSVDARSKKIFLPMVQFGLEVRF